VPTVAAFAWQPWAFLAVFIGLPVVLAIVLAKK
jgi:hypothetical protein